MISGEGLIPANEDGLARLVFEQGAEVKAAIEMMSGAVWVRDRLDRRRLEGPGCPRPQSEDVAPLA